MDASVTTARAFVEGYGRAWERWDVSAFVELFTDDVVYVAHPTEETVLGRAALTDYVRMEQELQGTVRVQMGSPVIDGARVAAEFWVTTAGATIAGCFIARLDGDGRASHFREYWFDVEGVTPSFDGWGS